ncbi:MAG: hypothetical protein ACQGVC_11810 [Myxococcota bacterium]
MEVATIVLEYLKVLAWPCVVAVAIGVFRSEIRLLVRSLQRLRLPGGTELDWKEQVGRAEAAADRIQAGTGPPEQPRASEEIQHLLRKSDALGLLSSPSDLNFSYYLGLCEADPNLALAGLRMELERLLHNIARLSGMGQDSSTAWRLSGLLRANNILPEDQFQLLRSIIRVANSALHGSDIVREDAERVIDSAGAFLRYYLAWLAKQREPAV